MSVVLGVILVRYWLGGGVVVCLSGCWVVTAAKERIHGLGISTCDLALGVVSASGISLDLALTWIGRRRVDATTGSIYSPGVRWSVIGADIDIWWSSVLRVVAATVLLAVRSAVSSLLWISLSPGLGRVGLSLRVLAIVSWGLLPLVILLLVS